LTMMKLCGLGVWVDNVNSELRTDRMLLLLQIMIMVLLRLADDFKLRILFLFYCSEGNRYYNHPLIVYSFITDIYWKFSCLKHEHVFSIFAISTFSTFITISCGV
jgi:hypothetical protein